MLKNRKQSQQTLGVSTEVICPRSDTVVKCFLSCFPHSIMVYLCTSQRFQFFSDLFKHALLRSFEKDRSKAYKGLPIWVGKFFFSPCLCLPHNSHFNHGSHFLSVPQRVFLFSFLNQQFDSILSSPKNIHQVL